MFVPCPHCGFLVALVVSRDGPPQRCPRCHGFVDDAPGEADPPTPTAAAPVVTEPLPVGAKTPPVEVEVEAASPVAAPAPARPGRKHHAPSFLRRPASARAVRGPRWPGLLTVACLALLLLLQLLLSQRAELAYSERWRPLADATCSVLPCEIPPWHEPGAFTMLARSVEPAGTPGVLRVRLSFRNDARWPQPWPTLLLGLSDVQGRSVAERAFTPDDYRAGGDAGQLAPGQSANVQFDVAEPSTPTVAFTFEFQ